MFRLARNMSRLCLPIMVLIAIVSLSCSGSKELNRSRALSLIKESKEFREPTTIALKSNKDIPIQAKSEDEPEQEAQAQAVAAFLGDYPEMAVLQHLGMVEVRATALKRPAIIKPPEFPVQRPNGTMTTVSPRLPTKLQPWHFKVETVLTEKGRRAANELPGSNGQTIPVARREALEVTGLTAPKEDMAQAEFTWRMTPTSVGEVFDPTSAEFKALPENLQRAIRDPHGLFPSTAARSFGSVNRSVGNFRRYDDGWRLVGVQ